MTETSEFIPLGKVIDVVMGQAPAGKDCNKEGVGTPFVKVGEFGPLRPLIREWTTDPKRLAQTTDVLLCVVGATCGKINLGSDVAIGRSVAALRPRAELLDQMYLFYFMLGQAESMRSGSVGAAQTVISKKMIADLVIPLPPLPEQQRIVAILDKAFEGIDRAIANTEKNLVNARELFESYLNRVFTEGGEGWNISTLGEVYDVRDGTHDSPKYHDQGVALITSKNLGSDGLSYRNVKYISEKDYDTIRKRSEVNKGDVLFAMIGTIGNPVVVEVEPDFAIKNVALFKVPTERNGRFLRYYLMSRLVVAKMRAEAKGTTQKFVGLGYLRAFPAPKVSIDLERDVVDALAVWEQKHLELVSLTILKLRALGDLKQSLLQKAFSGELTTDFAANLNDEVARAS